MRTAAAEDGQSRVTEMVRPLFGRTEWTPGAPGRQRYRHRPLGELIAP